MERKSFSLMQCPIARCLDRIGEWWTLLIVRDAFHGLTRFDQFEKSLGIAPNMLARRLAALVQAGILTKRRYHDHPPRFEYLLTDRGEDLKPVLIAMQVWGNKHAAPEGPSVILVDSRTGAPADPVLVDRHTGQPIALPHYVVAPGPAAADSTRRKLAGSAWGLPGSDPPTERSRKRRVAAKSI